jgi:hypothetical protein
LKREELQELHYITPIKNVISIMAQGILSNRLAAKIGHKSCASQAIQQRRVKVIVPNGKPLHDYANLYFNARNPMMYALKDNHDELAVLGIMPTVLDIPGVVISDRNASRDYTLFRPVPDGLEMIDKERTFAEIWTQPNPIAQYEHKGVMCAEVLVPDRISADYVLKAYVSSDTSYKTLTAMVASSACELEVVIHGYLFFR